MSKRFLLLLLLLAGIAVLVFAAFIIRRSENSASQKTSFQMSLRDAEGRDISPQIFSQTGVTTIRGKTTAPAFIELSRDNSILYRTGTTYGGDFEVINLALKPGINNLTFSATTMDSYRHQVYVSTVIIWEPLKPVPPSLEPIPATINTPELHVKGVTFPSGTVTIDVRQTKNEPGVKKRSLPFFQTEAKTDANGRFDAQVWLLVPAKYSFVAVSRNSQGALSKPSQEIETTYDPYWYPEALPAATAPLPQRRSATVTISHKQLLIGFQVVMAREDATAKALLANELTLSKFFDDTFDLRINGISYGQTFRGAEPQISLTDQFVTISATSNATFRDLMPILSGTVRLSIQPVDSLTIITNDYLVKGLKPAPTKLESNTAIWTPEVNPQSPSTQSTIDGEVSIQLEYRPLSSPSRAIRFLRVSPYSLWSYPANIVPSLLYGIFNAIPIFWIGLFLKSNRRQHLDANKLSPALQMLAGWSLVDTVWDIVYGVGYLVYATQVLRLQGSAVAEAHLIAVFLVVALFLGARLLTAFQANGAEWPRAISRALLFAALIIVVLISVFMVETGYPRLVVGTEIVLGFIVMLLIFADVHPLVRDLGITFKHPRWWGGVILVVLALLSVPFGKAPDNYFPHIDVLFNVIRDLAPPIAVVVLFVFLKKFGDSRQEEMSDSLTQAALIIFCGYLVGATTTLFMVPVPFILSFVAFRKFVITSPATDQKLAAVEDSVFESRRELIDKVIANDAAQAMKNNIDKLGEKMLAGNLKIEEFKTRVQEIEAYALEHEQAATLKGDIAAEDAVLSVGASRSKWLNAVWAVKIGALLSLPFLIVYLVELLIRGGLLLGEHYRLLISLTRILTFLAEWLIAAFFFGYFFKNIRGNSGLKKGLRVGCAVIGCFVLVWLVSTSTRVELLVVFLRAVQTFLFFTFLGLASDYTVFKEAMSNRFKWRLFTRFGDMPSFTAVASVIITTIGVTITTVLTGHFKDLVALLVGSALNQPGSPHP